MKTINFLTGNFVPENCAGTNRIFSLVKELEKNFKINVICISEKGCKPTDIIAFNGNKNVNVYYIHQKNYDSEKFYTRAVHEFFYAVKLALKSNKFPCDIIIATSPQMFIIPSVGMFSYGKKIIDIRDLVWGYIDENSLYNKLVKKVITIFMKQTIKLYDYITVTNNHEYRWIVENISNAQIEKITNGIEAFKFEELSSLEKKEVKPFTLTYIGNVGIAQNIKVLVDIAKKLKDIQINIIGEGNKYLELKNYARKNQISNITFYGKVNRDEIFRFYEQSSVLFAQLDEKFKAAMPSKLYEYASTGLPIIYAGFGEARNFINQLENCTTVNPGDVKALEVAIKKYKDKSVDFSQKNKKFIYANFIREKQSMKMVDIVNKLLREK